MKNKKIGNNLFLTSFLPAVAYWYLDEHYPVRIALIGGISLSIAEILFEKFYNKHVHALSKFNFFLILFLGGLSLLGDNGIWFKMQPALSFWGVSVFFIYRLRRGNGVFSEMMEAMGQAKRLPDFIIRAMEIQMTVLFIFYGVLMAILAFCFPTSTWLFFKTVGLYIILGIFMGVQVYLNRKRMRGHLEKNPPKA
ncbi:MAG: septation protein IspZ [Bacteriovorax sp.]